MGGLETTLVPSVMVGLADGNALVAFIQATNPVATTLEILGTAMYQLVAATGNILAGSSSMGPNASFPVTKPDINAPGTNIFAAYADSVGAPPQFNIISGTSMATPHVAGAVALIIATHPGWSPNEVMSALMMTADSSTFKPDGIIPSDPDDVGSGTVDLTKAALAGLTLKETFAHHLAADPRNGGEPTTLNIASMRSNDCAGTCRWSRVFTNRLGTSATWNFAATVPATLNLFVSPTSITLNPGESRAVSFCARVASTDPAIQFGEVIATEQGAQAPDSRLTVAVTTSSVSPTPTDFCEASFFADGFEG